MLGDPRRILETWSRHRTVLLVPAVNRWGGLLKKNKKKQSVKGLVAKCFNLNVPNLCLDTHSGTSVGSVKLQDSRWRHSGSLWALVVQKKFSVWYINEARYTKKKRCWQKDVVLMPTNDIGEQRQHCKLPTEDCKVPPQEAYTGTFWIKVTFRYL